MQTVHVRFFLVVRAAARRRFGLATAGRIHCSRLPPHSQLCTKLTNMLECQALTLSTWQWATPAKLPILPTAGWVCFVHSVDPGALLGFARVVRGATGLGLLPRRIDVCETEDASLLLSLEHGWFRFGHWDIVDAERTRVGGVVGRHLLDDQGLRLATIWNDGPVTRAIRDRGGKALAQLETAAGGAIGLRFANDLDLNPFVRMVLLGAAILSVQ